MGQWSAVVLNAGLIRPESWLKRSLSTSQGERSNRVYPRRFSRRAFLIALSGIALTAGCGRSSRSEGMTDPASLVPAYPAPDYFATPDWLAGRIDEPGLRVLDASSLPAYREGHIPNAQHVWWQDTIEIHNPAYGMLVNQEGRQKLVREAGITEDSTVVCYDGSGGIYAARLVWMLQYMGFHGARLLNGGKLGWLADGYELTRDTPDPPAGGIDAIEDEFINAHAQDILARLDEPGLVLLDTRTESEREETWEGRLRKGMIPGSYWLPRDQFLNPGAVPSLVSADRLRQSLVQAGVQIEQTAEVIVYGLHATLACLPYLAVLGLDQFHVRLYDGSWSEWGMNHDLPLEPIPA